jgi:peptidoglycan/xylan/chitin deacetylase (PgdA/CDA1 family)
MNPEEGAVLKRIAKRAVHSLRAIEVFRYAHRRACRILTYHRFPEGYRDALAEHCEYIRRHYVPVRMSDIARALETGERLPNNAVALTVDDGFRDFLEVAHPVLQKYGIVPTVFVVSDFLDGKLWPWFNQVQYLYRRCGRKDAEIAAAVNALKLLPDDERRERVRRLPVELHTELPIHPPAEYASLTWDEVRKLAGCGVEFGAHTRTHPILSRVSDEATLRDEIGGSKLRVDSELGFASVQFCYPNGKEADMNDRVVRIVRECGFKIAVTTQPGMVQNGANPLKLPRLGMEPWLPVEYLAEVLSGVRRA